MKFCSLKTLNVLSSYDLINQEISKQVSALINLNKMILKYKFKTKR